MGGVTFDVLCKRVPMPAAGVADPFVLHVGHLSNVTTLHRL
jgi:hypothetical protein